MLFNIFYEFFTVCTSVVAEDPSGKHVAGCGSLTELVIFAHVSYLSTHTVYWYNIHFFSLWGGGGGGYGHIGKWIQGNVIFMRFCCCFKLSKKTEKLLDDLLADTCHRQMLTNWPSAIG